MASWPTGSDRTPLVVVCGETASGKTGLALLLAERFSGELICADSWTVYRDFDIGTAKPSAAEQARVAHHLLDVADPAIGFSAPQFQRLAQQRIAEITARGKLPIVVGGTGLYIDSLIYDFRFLPAPPAELRRRLSELSLEQLHAEVQQAGLDMSAIDTRNKRRVIRLLETNGQTADKGPLRPDTLLLGLATEREQLQQRITDRVDAMLAAGLETEVLQLAERYGWQAEPMKGIGYREWQSYSLGTQKLPQTRQRIIAGTLGLAKRQRTWFKRNHSIQWLTTEDKATEAVAKMTSFLST